MALVTIAQVDAALKLDIDVNATPEDRAVRRADLEFKISQAEDIVIDYIKQPDHEWDVGDTTASPSVASNVPGGISAAVIMVISALYDDQARADMLSALSGSDLKNPIVGLLYRHRDPSLA